MLMNVPLIQTTAMTFASILTAVSHAPVSQDTHLQLTESPVFCVSQDFLTDYGRDRVTGVGVFVFFFSPV